LKIVVECGQSIIVSCLDLACGMIRIKHGLRINLISTKSTMSDSMWKGVFLSVLLLVGDPFINLPQVNAMPVTQVEVAHNTSKT
jgi:hypothetical protein